MQVFTTALSVHSFFDACKPWTVSSPVVKTTQNLSRTGIHESSLARFCGILYIYIYIPVSSTNQHILQIFSRGTLFHPLAFAFPFCRACCDSLHGYCHSMLNLVSITATLGSDPAKIRKSFFFRPQCFDFSQRATHTQPKAVKASKLLSYSITQ